MVYGIWVPANEVGGDYFDHIVGGEFLELMVADVSGHSVGSALMMAMSRSVLRTLVCAGRGPDEVLDAANRLMFDDLVRANLFFSAFVGQYDPASRHFRYASAGHNPPLWVRSATGRCDRLEADGMLVGLMPEVTFESVDVALEEGDLVALYTDGIIEATAYSQEMYGEERLMAVLSRSASLAPAGVARAVLDDLRTFMGSSSTLAGDDLTLLILKVVPRS
jgi:sigma-B regulation protein RsbU (phosphoserine phosphatase)